MDNKTINQISGILEDIKKGTVITEEKKIAISDKDYLVISWNPQPNLTIVKSSEVDKYFSKDNGYNEKDINKIKKMYHGDDYDVSHSDFKGDILVVKM